MAFTRRLSFLVVTLVLGVSVFGCGGGNSGSSRHFTFGTLKTPPWSDSSTEAHFIAIADLLANRVLAEQSRNDYQLQQARLELDSFLPSLKGKKFKLAGKVGEVKDGYVSLLPIDASSLSSPVFFIRCVVYPAGPSLNNPSNKQEVIAWAKAYQIKKYGSVEKCRKFLGTLSYREDESPNNFFMIGEDIPGEAAFRLTVGSPVTLEGTLSHWHTDISNDLVELHICNCSVVIP